VLVRLSTCIRPRCARCRSASRRAVLDIGFSSASFPDGRERRALEAAIRASCSASGDWSPEPPPTRRCASGGLRIVGDRIEFARRGA